MSTKSVEFAFDVGEQVRVTHLSLVFEGVVRMAAITRAGRRYSVEYAREGEIENHWFYEEEIEAR